MVNMSAMFDKEIQNSLVAIVFTSLFPCAHCDLDLWPPTSKIKRDHPLTMANMSAKFDQETHNSLVSIVFTSLFPYMSIVTLIFDLWPLKSIGFILSSWLTCLYQAWQRNTQRCSLYRVQKVHARTERRTDGRTDGLTDGTTAALLYPHRNALRGDN